VGGAWYGSSRNAAAQRLLEPAVSGRLDSGGVGEKRERRG
jgi:hypothetical protein